MYDIVVRGFNVLLVLNNRSYLDESSERGIFARHRSRSLAGFHGRLPSIKRSVTASNGAVDVCVPYHWLNCKVNCRPQHIHVTVKHTTGLSKQAFKQTHSLLRYGTLSESNLETRTLLVYFSSFICLYIFLLQYLPPY